MVSVDPAAIEAVIATERRWVQAHLEMDLDTIAQILATGYRQIQSDGSVIGRQELLDSYSSGERRWQVAESSEYEVQLKGDTALLIGRWRSKGSNAGEAFDYSARFLAVYAREDGAWKLLADVSIPLAGQRRRIGV